MDKNKNKNLDEIIAYLLRRIQTTKDYGLQLHKIHYTQTQAMIDALQMAIGGLEKISELDEEIYSSTISKRTLEKIKEIRE